MLYIFFGLVECCVCNLKVQGAPGWQNPAGGERAGDEDGERGDGSRGPGETGERTRAGEAERRQREVTNMHHIHEIWSSFLSSPLTACMLLSIWGGSSVNVSIWSTGINAGIDLNAHRNAQNALFFVPDLKLLSTKQQHRNIRHKTSKNRIAE